MGAAGHVIGYLVGSLDLVGIVGSRFGGSQFKIMIIAAIITLLITTSIACGSVSERRLLPSASSNSKSAFAVIPELLHRTFNLPPRIQSICWIQFWSWIGWFPFLFYSSTWVGETYYRYDRPASTSASEDSHDALGNVGRLGSLSLVIMSVIQFSASVALPYMVASPREGLQKPLFTPRPPRGLPKALERILLHASELQPNLITAWMIAEIQFATIMVCAPLVRSLRFAMTLVAVAGVPWSISCWAPFAEMGVEINKISGEFGEPLAFFTSGASEPVKAEEDVLDANDVEMEMKALHCRSHSGGLLRRDSGAAEHKNVSTGDLAGIYLGVLNVYTTLPQFVSTFISWLVFSILESGKEDASDDDPEHHKWLDVKKDGPNAIAVCLFIGACCALVAAEATRRLRVRDKAWDEQGIQLQRLEE